MFVESLSFAASSTAGTMTAGLGTSLLTFTLALTPIGWVGIIIGGTIVIGAAASASIYVNAAVSENGGDWYDEIIKASKHL